MQCKAVLRRSWTLLNCGLLVLVYQLIPLLSALFAGAVVLAFEAAIHHKAHMAPDWPAQVTLAIVALIAWGFVVKLALDYALAPCFVMEDYGAVAAVRQSKATMKHHRLWLFALHLMVFLLFNIPANSLEKLGAGFGVTAAIFVLPLHTLLAPLFHRSLVPLGEHQETASELGDVEFMPAGTEHDLDVRSGLLAGNSAP